jgi:AGZA family xanthine/uracil permease-like MFS transporter
VSKTDLVDRGSAPVEPGNSIDRFFMVSARGSTMRREIRGGVTTFFTMAYIVVLNPLIIGTVPDKYGTVLGVSQVAAVTALVAGGLTILMGLIGRYPLAIAAGLGLNAFVALTIASQMSWPDAMGLVVLEGLLILLLVLTGFRTAVFRAIPVELKTAISVGIGLFIALIGFVDGGFVRRTSSGPVPVELGISGRLDGWPAIVFTFGLVLMFVLLVRGVRGALLIGIVASTLFAFAIEAIAEIGPSFIPPDTVNSKGWGLVVPEPPSSLVSSPDLELLGNFSLFGGFSSVQGVGVIAACLIVFTLMLADFFDTMGTVVGVGGQAGLLDEKGELPGVQKVLLVDSLAAAAGGAASASSNTTYVESASGVGEGARTGFASIITGLLFLVAMFFTPLVQSVPYEAATPALVVVGFLMASQVRHIDFTEYSTGIPAFLTLVIMPFTYSITNGIGAGFIAYVVIMTAQGRAKQVHPLMWGVSIAFVIYFAIEPLQRLLGIS